MANISNLPKKPSSELSLIPEIKCQEVTVALGGRPVLADITFTMPAGSCVALLGRNGAGKSTLLRALAGLVPVQKGQILIDDKVIHPAFHSAKMALLSQGGGLIRQRTALENVLCGALGTYSTWQTLWGFPPAAHGEAEELLVQLGLKNYLHTRTAQLSGGQQQRVAIARALMSKPQILLADEPVSGLDLMATEQVMETLVALQRTQGLTLIMVLHEIPLAEHYAERALFLNQGRVTYDGPARGLKAQFSRTPL